ncbi:MAG TPA: hypothetical protein VFP44_03915 [Usitatibacter sp.]|nr:hypothetical protein [Usitatibacter sp.]
MNGNGERSYSIDALFKAPVSTATDETINSLILCLAWFLAGRAIMKAKASARRTSQLL